MNMLQECRPSNTSSSGHLREKMPGVKTYGWHAELRANPTPPVAAPEWSFLSGAPVPGMRTTREGSCRAC